MGFSDFGEDPVASESARIVFVLEKAICDYMEKSVRLSFVSVSFF